MAANDSSSASLATPAASDHRAVGWAENDSRTQAFARSAANNSARAAVPLRSGRPSQAASGTMRGGMNASEPTSWRKAPRASDACVPPGTSQVSACHCCAGRPQPDANATTARAACGQKRASAGKLMRSSDTIRPF